MAPLATALVDLQDLMVTGHVLVIGMDTVVDQEGHQVNLVEKRLELLLTSNLHSGVDVLVSAEVLVALAVHLQAKLPFLLHIS